MTTKVKMELDYNFLFDKLFPIPRCITGKGYRKSLKLLSKYVPFKLINYKSGKKIYSWVIPKEWNVDDAYLLDQRGKKIIDFKKNNLSIVYYSKPVNKTLNLKTLQKNLYTIKNQPNLIPYVTSYYQKNWGFCLKESERKKLIEQKYQAVIKSSFTDGNVQLGLTKLRGKSKKTILISSYLCHPAMANNELSGPLVLIGLYNKIKKWKKRNYTYLFLINPETIGSICFISSHKDELKKNLVGGLVLTCLGGPNKQLSYKKSREGNSIIDKLYIREAKKNNVKIREFNAHGGSDERQYNSPEQNLPVGQISRNVYKTYKEYHTSGDDKKFMKISQIKKSVNDIEKKLLINEKYLPLKRLDPNCEIRLGKYGLYPNINHPNKKKYSSNTKKDGGLQKNIMLHLLSYADGKHNILDVADLINVDIKEVNKVYKILKKKKILF